MMGYWHGFGGWGMGMGWFFMLLFWGLVIAALVLLGRSLAGRRRRRSAREIVRERYARGEIDHAEFEQKLRDLER